MRDSPLVSVLIPSRNRLELLSSAIASVRQQSTASFEVVVSDNASEPGYAEYVRSLEDDRVRLLRTNVPVSVTENWNRALWAARGAYVIMLGDDDALAPGFFERFNDLLDHYGDVDALYTPVFHYAYPGVVPARPEGYLLQLDNSVLFRTGRRRYWLEPAEARRLGQRCLAFHHDVSFNAQHFVYSRRWMCDNAEGGRFYQSNYPDYYACFVTFLKSPRILIDNRPSVLVGISKRSYGYFHMNNRAEEGQAQFLGAEREEMPEPPPSPDALQALALPGVAHTRNWLLAAVLAQRSAIDFEARVDLRRYRRIQAVEVASAVAEGRASRRTLRELEATYPQAQRRLADMVFLHLRQLARSGGDVVAEGERVRGSLRVYLAPRTVEIVVSGHNDILDAYAACETARDRLEPVSDLIDDLADAVDRLAGAESARAELVGARAELVGAKAELDDTRAELNAARRHIAELTSAAAHSSVELERLTATLIASESLSSQRQADLNAAEARAREAFLKCDGLAGELESANRAIVQYRQELWPESRLLGISRALKRAVGRR